MPASSIWRPSDFWALGPAPGSAYSLNMRRLGHTPFGGALGSRYGHQRVFHQPLSLPAAIKQRLPGRDDVPELDEGRHHLRRGLR